MTTSSSTERLLRVLTIVVLIGLATAAGLVLLLDTRLSSLQEADALGENAAIARGTADAIQARQQGFVGVLSSYATRFRFQEAVQGGDRAAVLKHLRQLDDGFPELDRPFLVDPAGTVWAVYPEAPELYGRSLAAREWYQGVSRDWQPYVSSVYRSARDGALGVAIVVPIKADGGAVIGILGVFQRLEVIREWLAPIQIPRGDVYVVDRAGQFVFHRTRVSPEQLGDYRDVPVVKRLLAGEQGVAVLRNPVEDKIRLSAYRRIALGDWGVVVYRDPHTLLLRTRTLIVIVGGIALALAIAVAGLWATATYRRQQLAHAVRSLEERTRALQVAREDAERANGAKNEFLSRMSHELRTPLNSILGFAQLLEMSALEADDRESVEHVLRAGRHLLGLINEVLDLARIEAGRLALSPEPVEVQDAVEASVSLVRPLAADRHIALTVQPRAAEPCYVHADRQRVQQVLLNLLSNAVKYNRDHGAVAVTWEGRPDGVVRIAVRDTGPGIAPDLLGRMFTPFDRLGAEQTAVEGAGLGLALSRRLTEAMGGTLGVDSVSGEGSTFWLDLPTAEPLQSDETGSSPPVEAGQAAASGATVLYIEDNVANLSLVKRIFARRPGITLVPAMQGHLGLQLAREHDPALILLDLNLPDVPGHEVLARLQSEPASRHVPVVVLSADATPGQLERLLSAGARAYLTKPFDVAKLLALVDEILAGHAQDLVEARGRS